MNITDLAKLMNVTEADAAGFVAALRVWINKGYSLEDAIAAHMAVMTGSLNHAIEFANSDAGRAFAADAFFPGAAQ